jgi:asparaginyl-tRNA synthetase
MLVSEIINIFKNKHAEGSEVNVHGWVKSTRDGGKISFIEINDGSSVLNLQIVAKIDATIGYEEVIKKARVGSSILATGIIKQSTKGDGKIELVAAKVELLKNSDEDYPLQKKEHSLEFLRDNAHLRARTKTISAIMRVRSKLAYAIHRFFQDNGFI